MPQPSGESSKVKVKVRVNVHGVFSVSGASLVEVVKSAEGEEPMETDTPAKEDEVRSSLMVLCIPWHQGIHWAQSSWFKKINKYKHYDALALKTRFYLFWEPYYKFKCGSESLLLLFCVCTEYRSHFWNEYWIAKVYLEELIANFSHNLDFFPQNFKCSFSFFLWIQKCEGKKVGIVSLKSCNCRFYLLFILWCK